MHREETSDKLLVNQLLAHNEKAFRKLYDLYHGDVYAYSMSFLKQQSYAEEIVQEVFLKVWLHRENLNPELSFKSYLFTITRNLTFNFLRKAANDRSLRQEIFYHKSFTYNPIERQLKEQDFDIIKEKAVNLLPPKRKRIFEMSRDEGKSYDEISRELGISLSTVKSQMSKALKTIRDFLKLHGDITLILGFVAAGLI